MTAYLHIADKKYLFDLQAGIDISIPFVDSSNQVNCFYAPYFNSEIVKMGDFVGSVAEGGPVNFRNVRMNPHGNGTHTEGVGHITRAMETVNDILQTFHWIATLVSVYPTLRENGDRVIEKNTLAEFLDDLSTEVLILRTLPNDILKRNMKYSGTNPTYLSEEAMLFLVSKKVKHLLIDTPSVDREEDGGKLLAHHAFWSGERAQNCTITELIYVPNEVEDGIYLLNLQLASMVLDAVPSRPVLYKLKS